MQFKNLGLLIIDEEHRFGVKQKEKIKALRTNINILTLTATPIPRTLNMAMSSLRNLSIIATPPAKRLSIKTFVCPYDEKIVKEAITRELLRGGQVYYLHNNVKTIERVVIELEKLVPDARIAAGHGQMRERELERVMHAFHRKQINVLVCTTIIETGIDISSANTIIIERADRFGMAQLHQLRGRVGRSHHQAYAYLVVPQEQSALSEEATKRLQAIASTVELGSGFILATHDLEIRGAGELLGEGQSGQIANIGYTLYMDILEKTVKMMQKGEISTSLDTVASITEINLNISALIPDTYIPSTETRLVLYKRIALCADEDALEELKIEMIDRFGMLPESVKCLFSITILKLTAHALGINKIEMQREGINVFFHEKMVLNPDKIIDLIQKFPQKYRLKGNTTLYYETGMLENNHRIQQVENLLSVLSA